MVTTIGFNSCGFYSSNYGVNWTSNLGTPGLDAVECVAVGLDEAGTSIVMSFVGEGLYLSTNVVSQWILSYNSTSKISSVAYGGGSCYSVMAFFPFYFLTSTDGGITCRPLELGRPCTWTLIPLALSCSLMGWTVFIIPRIPELRLLII
jgi:hypothetical protein